MEYENKPNIYLVTSSIVTSFPGFVFILRGEYVQTSIAFLCCLFSILWHSTKPRYMFILTLDKFFAYLTVGVAIHTAARSSVYSLIPLSSYVGLPYVLYHIGYQKKCFCFDPDPEKATRWHMVIHIYNGIIGAFMAHHVSR